MKKKQYHYLSCYYNVINKKGDREAVYSSYLCETNETQPAGIPTMGYMVKNCRECAKKDGKEYMEGSFFILSMTKLTKAQYEALMDKKEG